MRISRILGCFFALLSAISPLAAQGSGGGQASGADTTAIRVKGVQFETAVDSLLGKPLPLLAGASVSFDVAGAAMAAFTPYGQYEAAARLNLRGRFFPTAEVGWGVSDHTAEETNLSFKTNAPYFRLGCDYNLAKNPRALGRIMAGLRYGFTSFKYDVSGPALTDPVWGTVTPFVFKNQNSRVHWAEAVFGLEARVWGILHLGWTLRYRLRLADKHPQLGRAWYVPGFGRNDGGALSGTFVVMFDI